MREELLKGLTEEQIKKVEGCNSSEELLALAKEEGITLNDEQLEAVSGGCGGGKRRCPWCGDTRWVEKVEETKKNTLYKCTFCEQYWEED
jgi:CRISPR/Cas system-associated protein Cas10 (large subunit of type III CRISPR-Cas system)